MYDTHPIRVTFPRSKLFLRKDINLPSSNPYTLCSLPETEVRDIIVYIYLTSTRAVRVRLFAYVSMSEPTILTLYQCPFMALRKGISFFIWMHQSIVYMLGDCYDAVGSIQPNG